MFKNYKKLFFYLILSTRRRFFTPFSFTRCILSMRIYKIKSVVSVFAGMVSKFSRSHVIKVPRVVAASMKNPLELRIILVTTTILERTRTKASIMVFCFISKRREHVRQQENYFCYEANL
jgi:hypothetical protein